MAEVRIKFDGHDATIRRMTPDVLSAYINDVYELVRAETGSRADTDQVPMYLKTIEPGSVELIYGASDLFGEAFERIASAVAMKTAGPLAKATVFRVVALAKKLTHRGQVATFAPDSRRPVVIGVDQPEPFDKFKTVEGESSIHGRIVNVRVGLHSSLTLVPLDVPNRKTVTAELASQSLAAKAGNVWGQTVELSGRAVWDAESLELVNFKATSFRLVQSTVGDFDAALRQMIADPRLAEALALAGTEDDIGGKWDE